MVERKRDTRPLPSTPYAISASSALLDETGWSTIHLRDKRYEAVIHMVTSADGAESFYTDANNEARYESKQQAITLDKKLVNAWVGHPHFAIIDNQVANFKAKIDKCVSAVNKYIGVPVPTSYYKKFLIREQGFRAQRTFDFTKGDKHGLRINHQRFGILRARQIALRVQFSTAQQRRGEPPCNGEQ